MLKIPFAIQSEKRMKTRGPYTGGQGPLGLVIHTTDGRHLGGLEKAKDTISDGIKNGYAYLDIAYTGELIQAHDIMEWNHHCGESAWPLQIAKNLIMKKGLSDELIGVEQNCAGKLTRTKDGKYQTWFKTFIPPDEVRYVTEKEWGCPTGYYHKLSKAQEDTLVRTIMWLYVNIEPFKLQNVVAHHEISGMKGIGRWRKSDCGGSLSMPMDIFREHLISNKKSLIEKYNIKKGT